MSFIDLDNAHGLSYLSLGDIHQSEPLIFLHGIMGSKKNLKTFAAMLVEQCPQFSALIFDLRNHGQSSKHWQPYTVEACAKDIAMACDALLIKPKKIIGHSFGGKVALVAALLMKSLRQVWLLDCPPGPIVVKKSFLTATPPTVLEIIEILSSVSWPVATRKYLVMHLIDRGVSNAIATWMTTNLVARDDGLYLVFEPAEIREMLLDFIDLDCWPLVSSIGERAKIYLVAAEHGQRVSQNDEETLEELTPKGQGFFHVVKNAGHFVHIDNPTGLIELMKHHILFD